MFYKKCRFPPTSPCAFQLDDGLVIRDETTAELFLQHINYFRFSGYALAFEQTRHVFISGTTFEQVRLAYEFDRALRDLVTESLEVIELDLRTAVAHTFSQTHGPFGHTAASNFMTVFDHPKREYTHADWLEKLQGEVRRTRNLFIDHYKEHYQEYPDLPIWESTEIMSFGALARMYRGMKKEDQKRVSSRYGLQPATLASWILHLVYVRNICAHHARLWDCLWSIKPDLPAGKIWEPPLLTGNGRLFATLLIQNALLCHCTAEKNSSTAGVSVLNRLSPSTRPPPRMRSCAWASPLTGSNTRFGPHNARTLHFEVRRFSRRGRKARRGFRLER